MARDRSRCPNCGADLDTTRFHRGPSLLQRAGSWFGAISFGPRVSGATLVAVLVVGYLLLQFL